MLKCLLISGFVLMSLLGFCMSSNENGASWTPEETSIIQSKILRIIEKRGAVIKQYKKMYPDRKYEAATNINAPKVKSIIWYHSVQIKHVKFSFFPFSKSLWSLTRLCQCYWNILLVPNILKLFVEWKMGKLDMSGANCLIV